MTYELIASPAVAEWVAKRVGLQSRADFGECYAIGVGIADRPVAGVVFNWFRTEPHGGDCRVTIACEPGSKWARDEVLRTLFAYPFEHFGCVRITALIKEGNVRSEKFCKHLGFRKEGVMRKAWDGKSNALVYGLLKSECRWTNG